MKTRGNNLPGKYRWYLFDADGTLFDYDKAEATALRRTFEEFGLEYGPSLTPMYRRINAKIWAAFEQAGASLTVFADRQTDRDAARQQREHVERDPDRAHHAERHHTNAANGKSVQARRR